MLSRSSDPYTSNNKSIRQSDPHHASNARKSNISPNAYKLFMILEKIRDPWINTETVMGMGDALITHGVLDGGENVVASAIKELKDGDLVEYNEASVRVKSVINIDGDWDDMRKRKVFTVGCNMVFVGVEMRGNEEWVEHIWDACASYVTDIMEKERLEEGAMWDILSAGPLEFAKVGKGDEDMEMVVAGLHHLSQKCKSNKKARDAWEAFMNQL
jgi:hypothetical protein